MGCHFLLQEIFPTQRLNPGLPHCRQIFYRLSQQGSLKIYKTSLNSVFVHLPFFAKGIYMRRIMVKFQVVYKAALAFTSCLFRVSGLNDWFLLLSQVSAGHEHSIVHVLSFLDTQKYVKILIVLMIIFFSRSSLKNPS